MREHPCENYVNLCVAGLPIRVASADEAFFAMRFSEYVREDDRAPIMSMRTYRCDEIAPPQGEPIERVKQVQVMRLADGRMCRYMQGTYPDGREGPVLFSITSTPDYADVEIRLLSCWRHPVFSLTDFEYMYTGGAFNNRLSVLGGGVLHSSSLAYNGQGIAFSAPSGTGKSTHTGLWQQHFGDAVEIINDDKPAIYFKDGQAMLCGTPWSGKTALNRNRAVPLRAIVFIERGEDNRIERLDTVESMFYLTSQISRPYYDESLGVRLLDFTEKLLGAVPVYRLYCTISRQAVDVVYKAVFSTEE